MKTTQDQILELLNKEYENIEEAEKAIRLFAGTSASNREQLLVFLSEHKPEDAKKALLFGIAAIAASRPDLAIEHLSSAEESAEKRWFLALAYKMKAEFDAAIKELERARSKGYEPAKICWQIFEIALQKKDNPLAKNMVEELHSLAPESKYYYYCAARLKELEGEIEVALDLLEKAVETSNNEFVPALFRLAYLEDLHGDEMRAVELYRECLEQEPADVNAAINLAILYEDIGKYGQAAEILEDVLKVYPDHPRAKLFLKDARSSQTMLYDEEIEKRKDKMQQILEIPITDFELSVRSRNCLKKMGIKTLGDLTKVTEAELLSYKNFGETSLNEIKAILASKNLRLGQALEEKAKRSQEAEKLGKDIPILEKPIDILQLSARSRGCLEKLGIKTIGELINKSSEELMSVKNFGQISLNEIKEKLASFGLSLRD